jgi:glycosyltransferase 2 family protein
MLRDKKFWIGVVVSLFFLVLVFRDQHPDQIWSALQQANYVALLPALVFYFAGVAVRTVRWQVLLRPILPQTSLLRLYEVVVIGYMANDVLPARLGEVVRAFVLNRRTGVTKSAILGTIVVERIFDGIIMVGFIALSALFITLNETLDNLLKIGSVLFLIALGGFIFLAMSPSRITRLIDVLLGQGPLGLVVPESIIRRAHRVSASFVSGLQVLRSGMAVLGVLATSLIAWLLETSMYWVLGEWGFNLNLPFAAYMLTTAAANLSTLVPSTPGYVGVFDFVAKEVLVNLFAIGKTLATTYVLVLHAALYFPVTLWGIVYMFRESLSWSDLGRLEKGESTGHPIVEDEDNGKPPGDDVQSAVTSSQSVVGGPRP